MENFIESLNENQKKAVLVEDGPVLVLAGAGSGKTRVLTSRIAYLVKEKNVYPSSILAITFTNKAAKEMRTRVESLLDNRMYFNWIGTFHAMCVKMLRMFCDVALQYDKNFVIYDTDDQKILMKDCLSELNLTDKTYPARMVINIISNAKNELISPKEFEEKNKGDFHMKKIAEIYTIYQKRLLANNAMDFDDLIFNTVKMLEQNEEVRSYFQNQFRYVLIDEYQDTNTSQYRLAEILARKYNNIFVVGDDDQAIYGWRGANIQNILNFEHDFKGCKTIKLERNYRSTSMILDAANAVIKNNTGRKGKELWTEKKSGDKIKFYKAYNGANEALYVSVQIEKLHEEGYAYNDMAVLYRTNAQSRDIELALTKKNIPYRVFGSLSFYSRKEVKDVLAYLKLILNSKDDIQFKRVINEPKRGIGKTTLSKLEEISISENISIFEAAKFSGSYHQLGSATHKLEDFVKMIELLQVFASENTLESLYDKLMDETKIMDNYTIEGTIESRSRIENIKELKSAIVLFEEEYNEEFGVSPKLEDFIAVCTLSTDQDKKENQSEVTIMTLHAAKGLEFPVVFITGMEEGLFPGAMSYESQSKLEEERRLCYVGITRAKDLLYLLNAQERTIYGKTQNYPDSRFLKEIPEAYIDGEVKSEKSRKVIFESWGNTSDISIKRGGKSIDFAGFNKVNEEVIEALKGDRVLHKKFGEGTVYSVTGTGEDKVFEIDFDMAGRKRLMAAFAKLKKI
ncbi:MAG: UvrD-helicase domain-containing protein [Clostridia bacterium]|nr:UvrD-helicase domain-containing protein [Clostridia bacterium]